MQAEKNAGSNLDTQGRRQQGGYMVKPLIEA